MIDQRKCLALVAAGEYAANIESIISWAAGQLCNLDSLAISCKHPRVSRPLIFVFRALFVALAINMGNVGTNSNMGWPSRRMFSC